MNGNNGLFPIIEFVIGHRINNQVCIDKCYFNFLIRVIYCVAIEEDLLPLAWSCRFLHVRYLGEF